MAQPSSMGPPMSPKEPRRSNRRSAHSSTSTSKSSGSRSPDLANMPLPSADANSSNRSVASNTSNTASARGKRAKDEIEEVQLSTTIAHRRNNSISSANATATAAGSNSKRTKRRGKDQNPRFEVYEETDLVIAENAAQDVPLDPVEDDEDAGITRCVCDGLADDDANDEGIMIQCETCKVWQHGPCMGFHTEDQIPPGDYYCELCKPDDHIELLKRLQRRQRQSSEKSVHHSRASRSHSPSHLLKPPKRRNTMNSRDAAYEESIQELLDASAAEAAASGVDVTGLDAGATHSTEVLVDEVVEMNSSSKRKRKRTDDDGASVKRKRSASSASEHPFSTVLVEARDESVSAVTIAAPSIPSPAMPLGGSKSTSSRNKRGSGRKSNVPEMVVDGEDGTGSTASRKHPNQYTYRGKSSGNGQPRRAPQANPSQPPSNGSQHDHGTRRSGNRDGGGGGGSGSASGTASSSRNAHHYQAYYNATQLPLFTSWGLPDYLAHLQSILPSDVPPPLVIRGADSFFREEVNEPALGSGVATYGEQINIDPPAESEIPPTNTMNNATGTLSERGVKVKWPAKRMSVADMNKRVRALLEWVGREQACAADRERRKQALQRALLEHQNLASMLVDSAGEGNIEEALKPLTSEAAPPLGDSDRGVPAMVVNGGTLTESPTREEPKNSVPGTPVEHDRDQGSKGNETGHPRPPLPAMTAYLAQQSTTKLMEGLMEELISFQERFGPGAKGAGRDRLGRSAVVA